MLTPPCEKSEGLHKGAPSLQSRMGERKTPLKFLRVCDGCRSPAATPRASRLALTRLALTRLGRGAVHTAGSRVPLGAAAPLQRVAPLLRHAERMAAAMVHERGDGQAAPTAAAAAASQSWSSRGVDGSPAGESRRGRLETGRGLRYRGQPGPGQVPNGRLPARRHRQRPARRGARGVLGPLDAGAVCVASGHGRGRARRNGAVRTPARRYGAAESPRRPPGLPVGEVRHSQGWAGRGRSSLAAAWALASRGACAVLERLPRGWREVPRAADLVVVVAARLRSTALRRPPAPPAAPPPAAPPPAPPRAPRHATSPQHARPPASPVASPPASPRASRR